MAPLNAQWNLTMIPPDFFNNMFEYVVEEGNMTCESAEGYFNLNSYLIQGLIGTPFMGILTTAIVAFFTKKVDQQTG